MSSEPLAASDLFQCKKCGDCCKGYGGTFVTPEDILAISDYIRTNPERFVNDYCHDVNDLVLEQKNEIIRLKNLVQGLYKVGNRKVIKRLRHEKSLNYFFTHMK